MGNSMIYGEALMIRLVKSDFFLRDLQIKS